MSLTSYISVFLLGFAGSLHCVGMCGPLQVFLTKAAWPFKLMYHYGRYIAYALAGTLFFFVGYGSKILFAQKYFTILAGFVIIVMALFPFIEKKIPFPNFVGKVLQKTKTQNSYFKFFISGFANGLLPCGLVYVAATQSLLADDFWQSLTLMFLFLLGTLPALFSLNYIYEWMGKGRFYFEKLKPVIMLSMGVLMIFRGVYAPSQNFEQNKGIHKCVSLGK